jgi:hypothetical protein
MAMIFAWASILFSRMPMIFEWAFIHFASMPMIGSWASMSQIIEVDVRDKDLILLALESLFGGNWGTFGGKLCMLGRERSIRKPSAVWAARPRRNFVGH